MVNAPAPADATTSDPETPVTSSSSAWRRYLWIAAGVFCFVVGAVGVALPGLPTTGPMILALACFARGSPRLHCWLWSHPLFGPPLRRWKRERTMPLRAKVLALAMMATSLGYVLGFSPLGTVAKVAVAVALGVSAVIVYRIPHAVRPGRVPPRPDDDDDTETS
ncbi:MAG: YbaN family protein [Myxococcota bacterium]